MAEKRRKLKPGIGAGIDELVVPKTSVSLLPLPLSSSVVHGIEKPQTITRLSGNYYLFFVAATPPQSLPANSICTSLMGPSVLGYPR